MTSAAATREQAQQLDLSAAAHGVPTAALMALAGFQCAVLARRLLLEASAPKGQIAVLVGRGNNGADALGSARHLSTWGFGVRCLVTAEAESLEPVQAASARAATACGTALNFAGAAPASLEASANFVFEGPDLILDGLLGTGARGAPRPLLASLISRSHRSSAIKLAIDLPSGLDCDSGEVAGECVRADHTLMLGVAKLGCLSPPARHWVGQLWLADIGIPLAAYRDCDLEPPAFGGADPHHYRRPSQIG